MHATFCNYFNVFWLCFIYFLVQLLCGCVCVCVCRIYCIFWLQIFLGHVDNTINSDINMNAYNFPLNGGPVLPDPIYLFIALRNYSQFKPKSEVISIFRFVPISNYFLKMLKWGSEKGFFLQQWIFVAIANNWKSHSVFCETRNIPIRNFFLRFIIVFFLYSQCSKKSMQPIQFIHYAEKTTSFKNLRS